MLGSYSQKALRVSTRYFSTLIPNYKQLPGLYVGKDFTTKKEQQQIFSDISDLFESFRKHSKERQTSQSVSIPQVSKSHNLPTAEAFWSLEVPVKGSNETLKVEYFSRYGEDGHELAYIRGRKRGNNNLPPFAWNIAQKISESIANTNGELKNKYTSAGAEGMTWRLTLNYYTGSKEKKGKRAGFPFHTDIQANGDETYIVGFGNPAKMEFKRHAENAKSDKSPATSSENETYADQKFEPSGENEKSDEITRVEVEAGDMVGLTGEVRNVWVHRVVPEEETLNDRVSMVLGCRP